MQRAVHNAMTVVGCVLGVSLLLKAQSSPVASHTWAPGGTMAQPRTGASAALLPDGRVLITGGVGLNGATATEVPRNPRRAVTVSTDVVYREAA